MATPNALPIRILLCAAHDLVERPVRAAFDNDPEFEIVGAVADGIAAVSGVRRWETDALILDVGMDERAVTTTISRLRKADADVRVVMVGSVSFANVRTSMKGMMEGAVEFIATPTKVSAHNDERQFSSELKRVLKALGRRASAKAAPSVPTLPPIEVHEAKPGTKKPKILLIGSSTGGPQAVTALLKGLGTNFPLPILITQHMPAGFTAAFARSLSNSVGIDAIEGMDGGEIKPGRVMIAPGGKHMLVKKEGAAFTVRLDDGPQVNFCKPAVDPMFETANAAYDGHILAVVLTGMGADGRDGAKSIVERGGTVIAQDRESSVVWGMPGAVAGAGLAAFVLPLDQIADKVRSFF